MRLTCTEGRGKRRHLGRDIRSTRLERTVPDAETEVRIGAEAGWSFIRAAKAIAARYHTGDAVLLRIPLARFASHATGSIFLQH